MTRHDAERLQAVRRYLHWLLHQRIIKSHIQVHGVGHAGRAQREADEAANDQRESDVIGLITAILREDAACRQADAQQLRAAAPPLYLGAGASTMMYSGRGGRGARSGGPFRGGPPPSRGAAGGVRILSPAAPVFVPVGASPRVVQQQGWQPVPSPQQHHLLGAPGHGHGQRGRGVGRGGGRGAPGPSPRNNGQPAPTPPSNVVGSEFRGRGRSQRPPACGAPLHSSSLCEGLCVSHRWRPHIQSH